MLSDHPGVQRRLERAIRIPRFARIALGAVVLTAGAFFVVVSAYAFLYWIRQLSVQPHTMRAAALSLWGLGLSLGFVAVGFRLVQMRTSDEHLFGPVGLRITAYCGAVLAVGTLAEGLRFGDESMSLVGAFLLLIAVAVHRSARRVNVRGTTA